MHEERQRRMRDLYLSAGVLAAFLIPRIILAAVREPFFDELFTLWIARKSPLEILAAVRFDSGPPLYYFLIHLLGIDSEPGLRTVSLLFALATCALLLAWTPLGPRRFIAAALLAIFPPHVYFSGEGRAYAMTAFAIAVAVLACHTWSETSQRRWLVIGCAALLVAAYSHYYGALFFATPLLVSSKRTVRDAIVATVATIAAFVPGIVLALSQPREAVAWMTQLPILLPLQHLAFAARYPDVFLPPVPTLLQVAALLTTLVIAWLGRRDTMAFRFAMITLTPVLAAIVLRILGYAAYFPVRFESVLAVPFVLWMASALAAMEPRRRLAFASLCVVMGAFVSVQAAMAHFDRGPDPIRRGAMFIALRVDPSIPIVASSYAYLETLSIGREAAAFPREQALHPGWRASASPEQLSRELDNLPPAFVWVGEEQSMEAAMLHARYRLTPLLIDGGIVVARAERR